MLFKKEDNRVLFQYKTNNPNVTKVCIILRYMYFHLMQKHVNLKHKKCMFQKCFDYLPISPCPSGDTILTYYFVILSCYIQKLDWF